MKKIATGLVALVMVATASAFALQGKNEGADEKVLLHYWYINSNGTLGSYLGSFNSHADAVSASTCPDIGAVDCARGYTSSTPPSNPALNIQDRIKKQ